MRDIQLTQTGAGQSQWVPLDKYISPEDVGLFVKVTAPVVYTIEFTEEDPFQSGGIPSGTNGFPVPGMESEVANAASKLPFPARAVRINQASGAGSTRLTIVQAGIGGT